MQKTELEQRQSAIKSRFDELTQQKEAINNELFRLQGQFELLGELISNYSVEKEGETNGSKSRRAKELTK